MGRKVNMAVIGTGRMGSVHVRNLARLIPEANLVASATSASRWPRPWPMSLASAGW